MELKHADDRPAQPPSHVLIVPFMELKQIITLCTVRSLGSLNRTFYGIETMMDFSSKIYVNSLNRTFYGIETSVINIITLGKRVLIVPFMELKQENATKLKHLK